MMKPAMMLVMGVVLAAAFGGSASAMRADQPGTPKKSWGGPGGLVVPLYPYTDGDGGCYSKTYDCGLDDAQLGTDKNFTSAKGTCRTVHAIRRRRNLAFQVVYTYYEQVSYCWLFGKVTSFYRSRWTGGTSFGWSFDGHVYTSCGPQDPEHCTGKVGEYSETAATQGHYHVCLGAIGINYCKHKYPWLSIWVHGDGGWGASTSG